MRHARSSPGSWSWLGIGLLGGGLSWACSGPTTSLDAPATTTAVAAETTAATGSSSDEGSTGEPPLVLCAPECLPLLQPTWSYEGPGGHHAVVELLREPEDGTLWLGLQQNQGVVGVARLSGEGELDWTVSLGLPCSPCELTGLAQLPSGDLVLSATEPLGDGPAQALVARLDVEARALAWVRSVTLTAEGGARVRAGEVVVLADDRIALPRVDGYGDEEAIDVLDFDAEGTLRSQRFMLTQRRSSSGWPLVAARGLGGELLLGHAWWNEELERMQAASSRLLPPRYSTLSRVPLLLTLDDLAIDGAGRRLELARSDGSETITLLVTSRRGSDPERWSASLPLLSTSSTRATLAVGPDDDVYVAARTTPRLSPSDPAVTTMLAVARWSPDGRLRWQAARPLDMMATVDPVELAIDDDDGIVVGTVLEGHLHVVRYEQRCACE